MRKEAFRSLPSIQLADKENMNMNKKIALCADSKSLQDPNELGIKGERILDQSWIVAFADALIARQYLREHTVDETWVVSSDSIDGINLAAALKKDNEDSSIRLFLASPSGSKMSRCQNAGIVPICGKNEFAHLYATNKAINERSSDISEIGNRQPSDRGQVSPAVKGSSCQFSQRQEKRRSDQEPSSTVTVQRIDRTGHQDTDSLPGAEIEEAPSLEQATSTMPIPLPQRKGFDRAANEHNGVVSSNFHEKRHAVTPATDEGASIVSIISGSGGTGKSSISTLAALLAQNHGYRTLLLDADFQFGDLQYLLGYKQPLETNEILARPEQIDTLLKVDTWPALLSAPSQLEYSEVAEKKITELLAYLKPHFDLIVVNTGTFWSDLQIQLLEVSNHVFFLLDQRPSSIRACNHALDLCARCGIATTSFSYLLNFCSKKSLLSALDVSCALKGAKVHEIKDGGTEVGELLGAGMAHKLARLNNPLCTSIEALLKETVYARAKPSLEPIGALLEKPTSTNVKAKLRSRQKRKAACY